MRKYFILTCIFSSLFASSLSQEEVPVEILFKDNIYSMYRLSPNGDYLATIMEHNVGYEILVIDLAGLYIYQSIPIGKQDLDNLAWIDRRRLIYEINGELFTINIDGTDNNQIMGIWKKEAPEYIDQSNIRKYFRVNHLLNALWDEKDYILVESTDLKNISSIFKVDLFSGEMELLEDGKKNSINSWIANRQGDPLLGIRYSKNDKIELLRKCEKGDWIETQITLNGGVYELAVEGSSYLNNSLSLIAVGYDQTIYLGSSVSTDKKELIEYSFKSEESKGIFSDEKYDLGEPESNRTELIFNDKEKELLGIRYHGDKPVTKWLSAEYQALQKNLTEKYPGFYFEVMDVSHDASTLLLHIWHPTFPGRLGYVQKDSLEIFSLLVFNEEIEKYDLSETQIVDIPSRSGDHLLAYVNIPQKSESESIPLVVIPHGGPWARDYYYFEPISQFFADKGFATLRLNFHGSTGFGSDFFNAGIKSIHSTMIDDLYDGAKYCIDKFLLDTSNIFMYGHSYGGYASVMSTLRYPEFYKSVVSVSAPYDIYEWMKLQKKQDNQFAYEMWETTLGSLKDNKEFIRSISPVNCVEKLNVPILIFHGEKDNNIPIEQAREFKDLLEKHGKEFEHKFIQNEGHSLQDGNNSGYILKKSVEFFKNQMGISVQ